MYKIIGADQKEYGPITADQLRQWISEGRINASTRIQAEGESGWKSVSEFSEFVPALRAIAPPVSVAPAGLTMAPVARKSNQLALWAMITGIVSVVCCCQILGPVSIILGIIGLSQIKNHPPQQGSGFAIAGIVLGVVALILLVISVAAYLSNPQSFSNLQNLFPH